MALSTIQQVIRPAILYAYITCQECQLTKYSHLIGAATIVAVAQVPSMIVTRPSRFALLGLATPDYSILV